MISSYRNNGKPDVNYVTYFAVKIFQLHNDIILINLITLYEILIPTLNNYYAENFDVKSNIMDVNIILQHNFCVDKSSFYIGD